MFHSEDESVIAWAISCISEQFLKKPSWGVTIKEDILKAMVTSGKVLHKEDFSDNAYLKNIHFENQRFGQFEVSHVSTEKYEMICSMSEKKIDGVIIPQIGIFDGSIEFPQVKKNGKEWMCVEPYEIFTVEQPIKNASGKVLTLGCGLGYYAYMVSEKDNVDSVTIIERDPDVIELFTTHILPQFPHKEKITILQADEVEYMKNLEDARFDCCFADTWGGDNDVVSYVRLKNICRKFTQTRMDYWNEDFMIEIIMSYVYFIITEEITKEMRIPKVPTNITSNEGQVILDYLSDLLKDREITRAEHVDYYMDRKTILRLMG
jgi:hypothetical protein